MAYAIAGSTLLDLTKEPLGQIDGKDIFLKDIWPSQNEIEEIIENTIDPVMFSKAYEDSIQGDDAWKNLETPQGEIYQWQESSTYIKKPPYFESMTMDLPGIQTIKDARVLALLGDSVTTDHISPAGNIDPESPAGIYLKDKGVERKDFNSYGSRRGNHEVMMRGTFANIRLRNKLAPGTEGGWTSLAQNEKPVSIFEAAEEFRSKNTDLIVLAGKEYGTGSSRDWAAKGVSLLGVKAVIAESYERIHRSNLIGMGVLPLEFSSGDCAESIGLDGFESFDFDSITKQSKSVSVKATSADGNEKSFEAKIRIDTPKEWEYFEHGGILHYVIRRLVAK